MWENVFYECFEATSNSSSVPREQWWSVRLSKLGPSDVFTMTQVKIFAVSKEDKSSSLPLPLHLHVQEAKRIDDLQLCHVFPNGTSCYCCLVWQLHLDLR